MSTSENSDEFVAPFMVAEFGTLSDKILQIEKTRKELAPRAVIHTIGFWTEQADRWILETIASQSGGIFISVE